jgi:hypothetical protein
MFTPPGPEHEPNRKDEYEQEEEEKELHGNGGIPDPTEAMHTAAAFRGLVQGTRRSGVPVIRDAGPPRRVLVTGSLAERIDRIRRAFIRVRGGSTCFSTANERVATLRSIAERAVIPANGGRYAERGMWFPAARFHSVVFTKRRSFDRASPNSSWRSFPSWVHSQPILRCVSVWLDDLLGLEIRPKVFQRWDVDRRELIVAQPESLTACPARNTSAPRSISIAVRQNSQTARPWRMLDLPECCFASAAVLGAIRAFTALGTRLLDQNLTTALFRLIHMA